MPATWGEPTPSGHVYHLPKNVHDVRERMNDHCQGWIEHWDDAEMPPDPTWDVPGLLAMELDRIEGIIRSVADSLNADIRSDPVGWAFGEIFIRMNTKDGEE